MESSDDWSYQRGGNGNSEVDYEAEQEMQPGSSDASAEEEHGRLM